MNFKRFFVFILCLLLFVISAVACGRVNNRPNENRNENLPEQTRVIPRRVVPAPYPGRDPLPPRVNPYTVPRRENPMLYNNQMGTNTTTNRNYVDNAQKIANRVADLNQIDTAACVVTGNTAMIGVQFDKQYKGSVTNTIKSQCEKAAKTADPRIQRVVVTADPDLYSRLKSMIADIGRGKPISGFTQEMNELLNRIQPK